jgi:uncharacterized membrane protein YdbT with pleckstrin-like domain
MFALVTLAARLPHGRIARIRGRSGVGFPERLLSEDEELIYDLRPHWWTLVVPALATVVVAAGVVLAWVVIPAGDLQQPARTLVGLVGLVALAAVVGRRVLRWLTTHLVLTTERLIFRSGLVARFGREIPLERVSDVTVSQSLFERLIGTGDLLIEAAGEQGPSRYRYVRDPGAVQVEIYHQMEANGRRRGGLAATQPSAPSPARGPSVLDDLERLADLRDRGAVTEEEFQRKKRDLLDRL